MHCITYLWQWGACKYIFSWILLQGTSGFDGQPSVAPGQPGEDRFIGELGNPGVGGIRCQPVCTTRCFR